MSLHHSGKGQMVSNEGTEFWAIFPSHVPVDPNSLANYSIFITGKKASSGIVTAGSFSKTFNVIPNLVIEINIPRNVSYINGSESGQVLSQRAIRVKVNEGDPKIVVYGHIFAGKRSAASLILPKEALGQKYFSINYNTRLKENVSDQILSFIAIAAIEPNTKVYLKKGNIDLVPRGILLPNAGDCYQYTSVDDLTGVYAEIDTLTSACKKFAFFSGNTGASIVTESCEAEFPTVDPLYQQNYPIENWGNVYGYIPFSMRTPNSTVSVRTKGNFVRILAKDNGTQVQINGSTVAVLNSGEYYTTTEPLLQAAIISSNKPVCVAQYALSQDCSGGGNIKEGILSLSDPDMVILNPIEYNIRDITIYSSSRENISEQFVNILIKTSATSGFKVNGFKPDAGFQQIRENPEYSYLQLNLNLYSSSSLNLTADEGFNAIAYGFGDRESYAYSAGTNLATTDYLDIVKTGTPKILKNICALQAVDFKLTLPFKASKLTWYLDQADVRIQETSPIQQILSNGQIAYEYIFRTNKIYEKQGSFSITVIAELVSSGGCPSGEQEFKYTVNVIDPPTTSFSSLTESCINSEMIFAADSADSITTWLWDFGDGTTSTQRNAVHSFKSSGTYQVSLIAEAASGCSSVAFQKSVLISKPPLANFLISGSRCQESAIIFTDQSSAPESIISKWFWDFGDGTRQEADNNNPVTHVYKASGNYTVQLKVVNDLGCESIEFNREIVVSAIPKADFSLPNVCLKDASAVFNDKSIIPDNSANQFTYQWDFGDRNSSATNPDTSSLKNPSHQFSQAGKYLITLTVTSGAGCSSVKTDTLQVNGTNPKADFLVVNPNFLCSRNEVVLENASLVDIGKITRLEWYYDFQNNPDLKYVDEEPKPGKKYAHKYPDVFGTGSKNYLIKLIAYSGSECFAEVQRIVQVLTVPELVFSEVPNSCENDPPFKITQAREIGNIAGAGYFSGPGITPDGIFNPFVAGSGVHSIQYIFEPLNGCSDTIFRLITVFSKPDVDAGNDTTILEGGQIRLNIQVTGDSLTYKWSPSIGLDNDTSKNPVASPSSNTIYTVVVSGATGCVASDKILIRVLSSAPIPNTFTPNGDGVNDLWNIKYINSYPDALMKIYNRYGAEVYFTKDFSSGWDGQSNGKSLPTGTYYYIISPNNGRKPISGSVTIIR